MSCESVSWRLAEWQGETQPRGKLRKLPKYAAILDDGYVERWGVHIFVIYGFDTIPPLKEEPIYFDVIKFYYMALLELEKEPIQLKIFKKFTKKTARQLPKYRPPTYYVPFTVFRVALKLLHKNPEQLENLIQSTKDWDEFLVLSAFEESSRP